MPQQTIPSAWQEMLVCSQNLQKSIAVVVLNQHVLVIQIWFDKKFSWYIMGILKVLFCWTLLMLFSFLATTMIKYNVVKNDMQWIGTTEGNNWENNKSFTTEQRIQEFKSFSFSFTFNFKCIQQNLVASIIIIFFLS